MIVISDTSILNAFYKIRLLALLPALYGKVIIPQKVYDELMADDVLANWLSSAHPHWLAIHPVQRSQTVEHLLVDMDAGEAEALTLAQEISADVVLMDDHAGRRIAQELGIPVIGTLGILLAAKEEGLIPAIRPVLVDLTEQTKFWVSESLLNSVLKQANE
ncbi:DUF3368 domain-containing protein [Nibrella viscosa]|uniref:DUF3368 domain-containing protein n=1 Tax=Nibrella viscosa TaxID=1084524 RepID=A0ABP8K116_9BACT